MDNMRFASDLRLALDLIMEAARARPNESVIVRLSEPCDTNPSACKLERVEPYGIHHSCGVGCKTRDTNPDAPAVDPESRCVGYIADAGGDGYWFRCRVHRPTGPECKGCQERIRVLAKRDAGKVPAVDTNPDAAAAEAAQEAVEEPVHGQDDPVYLRAMIANRDKQLKAMTSERDKLSKELEELGVTHGILHGQFVSAIEDCDKMTSERDALKAKFDEAMGGLLRSVHNIGVDITYFKTGSPSQHQLEVTRDCMSNVIARLESK